MNDRIMSDPTRLAWLIERGQSMQHVPTVWWTGDEWTTDAWAARRFDTREDAEAAIRVHSGRPTYGPFGIAVEHGFLDTTYHRRRVARRKSEHRMSDPTREALEKWLADPLRDYLDDRDRSYLATLSTTPAPDLDAAHAKVLALGCIRTFWGAARRCDDYNDGRDPCGICALRAALEGAPHDPE